MDKVTGFEVPAGNMKKARKFFKNAFGWKSEEWGGDYSHLMTVKMDKNWVPKEKGAINGGMFKRKSKNEKPLLIITVDSIIKSLEKVKKAGGKIVTNKTQAGEWGWWAEIKDTEENIFELWEDKQ